MLLRSSAALPTPASAQDESSASVWNDPAGAWDSEDEEEEDEYEAEESGSDIEAEMAFEEPSEADGNKPPVGKIIGIAVIVGALIGGGAYIAIRPGADQTPAEERQRAGVPASPGATTAKGKVELDRGLIGHWSFEEGRGMTVADLSGNRLTGTLQGDDPEEMWVSDPAPTALSGKFALKLTDAQNVVNIPADTTLGLRTNITMCGWVKLHSTRNALDRDLINRRSNGGLRLTMGGLAIIAQYQGKYANSGSTHYNRFEPGRWMHVLATYDGKAIRTYVNAGQPYVQSAPGHIREITGAIILGRQGGSPMEAHFTIDDVRIYDRVLNDTEIGILAGQIDEP